MRDVEQPLMLGVAAVATSESQAAEHASLPTLGIGWVLMARRWADTMVDLQTGTVMAQKLVTPRYSQYMRISK